MKVAFVGATAGMGRSLARLLAENGDALFLLGRNPQNLERSAEDLRIRSGKDVSVGTAPLDLGQPDGFDAALDAADEALGGFDLFVITAGLFATQEKLEEDEEQMARLVTINYGNTVILCEKARKRMLSRGGGKLCVFSSVAGDRGRKPVAIYGSTKAGLSAYLEALDHKFRSEGLVTICVKPGFVKTSMTEGLDPPPFAGEPDGVAKDVFRAIQKNKPLIYTPRIWGLVMFGIKRLPRFMMRRIGF